MTQRREVSKCCWINGPDSLAWCGAAAASHLQNMPICRAQKAKCSRTKDVCTVCNCDVLREASEKIKLWISLAIYVYSYD